MTISNYKLRINIKHKTLFSSYIHVIDIPVLHCFILFCFENDNKNVQPYLAKFNYFTSEDDNIADKKSLS